MTKTKDCSANKVAITNQRLYKHTTQYKYDDFREMKDKEKDEGIVNQLKYISNFWSLDDDWKKLLAKEGRVDSI